MSGKNDSKSNLNESTLPLLDLDSKEKIELEPKKSSGESETTDAAATGTTGETTSGTTDDSAAVAAAAAAEAAKKKKEEEKERKRQAKLAEEEKKKQEKLEKQKKKEEEKALKKQQKEEKEKEKKAAAEAAKSNNGSAGQENGSGGPCSGGKTWTAYNQFTVGINLLDRDERSVNEHVNVNFEDIIGEPDAAQGFDAAYRLSFGLFQFIRFWLYRILMTILAIPFALIWAVVFALLTLVSVWILTPAFRVLDILLYFFHRLWNVGVRTILDPIFVSISLLRQNGSRPLNVTPVPTTSGKAVYQGRQSVKYNQLSASETVASYTKTDTEDQVALNLV